MKFFVATLVQVFMGLFLMWGILQSVQGSYWLLTTGLLAYGVAFIRTGCLTH
jgi:hypothetical protein